MTTTSMTVTPKVDIRDVPNVIPSPLHVPRGDLSKGGLPQVTLPSGHAAIHLTKYDDVRSVLADSSFARAETNIDGGPTYLPTTMPPEMLLNLDAPDHARLKGLTSKFYSAARMAARDESVSSVLDELTKRADVDGRGSVDLMTEILAPTTIHVNCELLGIDPAEIPLFHTLSVEMQMASSENVPHLIDSFWRLYGYLNAIAEGARDVGEGLISEMMAAGGTLHPPMTTKETVATLIGSLVGADQNVLSTLSKMLYVLLARPELWDSLCREPSAIPKMVDELFRLLPLGTISTFPRVSTKTVELPSGYINPGDVVVADAGQANIDSEKYSAPTTIDLTRRGPRHLQFGYGMHHCMGAAMAKMEIETTLRFLVDNYPNLQLVGDAEHISWDSGVLVHRPAAMPVTFHGQ